MALRPIRTSAKAIIVQNERLLVNHNHDSRGDWYCLPGGGQEAGETILEALIRECREEIDCLVEPSHLRFVREYIGRNHPFHAELHADVHQVEFMFECALATDATPQVGSVPDNGQIGVSWIPLDALHEIRLFPGLLKRIGAGCESLPMYWGDTN